MREGMAMSKFKVGDAVWFTAQGNAEMEHCAAVVRKVIRNKPPGSIMYDYTIDVWQGDEKVEMFPAYEYELEKMSDDDEDLLADS